MSSVSSSSLSPSSVSRGLGCSSRQLGALGRVQVFVFVSLSGPVCLIRFSFRFFCCGLLSVSLAAGGLSSTSSLSVSFPAAVCACCCLGVGLLTTISRLSKLRWSLVVGLNCTCMIGVFRVVSLALPRFLCRPAVVLLPGVNSVPCLLSSVPSCCVVLRWLRACLWWVWVWSFPPSVVWAFLYPSRCGLRAFPSRIFPCRSFVVVSSPGLQFRLAWV